MAVALDIRFGTSVPLSASLIVLLTSTELHFGAVSTAFLGKASSLVSKAAAADRFKGKPLTSLDIVAPTGVMASRLIIVGLGPDSKKDKTDWVKVGAYVMGCLPSRARSASIILEAFGGLLSSEDAADFSLGMRLRAYTFDRYKTRRKGNEAELKRRVITLIVGGLVEAKKASKTRQAIADGVYLARDLVNEPPNVLFPEEFASRIGELENSGVDVQILDERAMRKFGMGALLGVGQGSARGSRVAIMRWSGAKANKEPPIAFVGKGVTFDTGGISIKQAAGMEDMKGDMAGAACVVGLMCTLAARKAKVNAVGVIGLVENMPDGKAQRPGDIVTSMSGQTIEIINTDAEGRLVLADVLWYVQDRFKPRFMIDLATLTGAILISLAQEYAGLFSNNDELAARLFEAGQKTGERVWRLPLASEYDKMIDSKFADMKNAAGRHGGSITAAQFLQRFVNDTPWAHLDIAGTAMGAPASETSRGWASGWGVRLLDRLVADHYES